MREVTDLNREELTELLEVITGKRLKKICKVIKDKGESTLHITFTHDFRGKELRDYILLHHTGFFGSICATYSFVALENGDCLSLEQLAKRFYTAKGIYPASVYPFKQVL